jgi:hypothetical protein
MTEESRHPESGRRGPVLLLPQNGQHLETARILLPELTAAGLSVAVVLMDGVFRQGLDARELPPDTPVRHLEFELDVPFYRLGPVRQIAAVLRAVRPMQRAIGRPAVIVAFNDGALQRLAFRVGTGARTVLVIDGMISEYAEPSGFAHRVRSALKRVGGAVRATPLGIVMPSDVGLSPVDVVFVLGEHSADVLRRSGAKAERIVASGLPRWPHVDANDRPSRIRNVLYLTAAFAWHDRHDADRAQVRDVEIINGVCGDLGLAFVVRVHPRDAVSRWEGRGLTIVASQAESMEDSIRHADLVLAMVSTGLLEAISLGRIARPVIMSDSFENYANSFVADPFLGAIRSRVDLEAALIRYAEGVAPADYEAQRDGLIPYVAASGPTAAREIVSAIIEAA